MNNTGFVKLMRSDTTRELLRDVGALHLLAVIALRARYTTEPSLDGLTFGQALVGDWDAIGMSEKEYRGAKKRLQRMRLADFQGISRGTIATLCDTRVFSLRDDRKLPKRGTQKGEPTSGLFPEGECGHGADEGAGSLADRGRMEGGQRAANQKESTNQTGKNSQSTADDASFLATTARITHEVIYQAYPRKKKPKDALKAIAKAMHEVGPERLLERTKAFAAAVAPWPASERKFIPYPATWFNAGGYDEDPREWVRESDARPGQRDSHNADTPNF